MTPTLPKSVAVIGAGQMGAGIAQVCAASGISVLVYDKFPEALTKCRNSIEQSLSKFVEKQKLTTLQKDQTLSKIQDTDKLSALRPVDLVIEAIAENAELKCSLFSELDSIVQPQAIFASNTSSISITALAAAVKRPDRFIGMHFMNPVPLMQLIEIIRGLQTSDETYQSIISLCKALGKTPVTARRDYPGFIVNRILMPMINEAVFVLMEGIATAEEIDTAMKLGTNQPMGPLELADFVGLDTCLAITRVFHRELGEDKYRPCPLMVKHVEAGWLGRKTGRGFYIYS